MNECTRQDLADLEVVRIQETLDKAVLALEEGREPEVHVQGGKLEGGDTFQEAFERDHGEGAAEGAAEAAEAAEAAGAAEGAEKEAEKEVEAAAGAAKEEL